MAADGGGAEQARIGIFLRLRPVARPSGRVLSSAEEGWVEFNVPRDATQGLINNSRESYRFPFDGLLPPEARQEEVFDRVALPVLRSALDGYNGTVFAFGQTGSGKTFTITGGAERYADRGLIPRAISALFAETAARGAGGRTSAAGAGAGAPSPPSPGSYSVHVSYMEIYNEAGFDLLEPGREVRALEDLPRVHIQEDDDSRVHFRNLSMHRCDTEEQALNMLFLGDTNRVVAETPLNQASSRSHCVFTLHIEARGQRAGAAAAAGEAVVRRSKLHFVDLAGSERVGKTGLLAHAQLREAKYINLSLHFLEQVIISLQEGRPHVPYRNSVLTMALRDSLGGNTRTVMVAAVAPEAQHIEESISTCRFAQRVAMISNRVEVNEELDLEVLVRRLKQENALLRQELQLLRDTGGADRGGSGASGGEAAEEAGVADVTAGSTGSSGGIERRQALNEEEQRGLRRQVQAFVEDPAPDAILNVEASMLFIRSAFDILKALARQAGPAGLQRLTSAAAAAGGGDGDVAEAAAELGSLRLLVQQQEQQIGVLAGVLRTQGLAAPANPQHSRQGSVGGGSIGAATGISQPVTSSSGWRQQRPGISAGGRGAAILPASTPYSDELLADQHKAFEYFCATSPAHVAVAAHKAVLRSKYEEARALGSHVAASKQCISELKSTVEQRRLARSMAALLWQQQAGGGRDGSGSGEQQEGEERQQHDAEEERAKGLIEKEKAIYREAYSQLRDAKAEIDGEQALLERSRARLQHDFQAWYAAMAASSGGGGTESSGAVQAAGAAAAGGQQLLQGLAHQQQQKLKLQYAGQNVRQQDEAEPGDWSIPAASARAPTGSSIQGSPARAAGAAPAAQHGGDAASSAWQQRPSAQPQQQPAAAADPPQDEQAAADAAPAADPYAGVAPEVLAAARPLLTGNPQADADIIRFYQARAALLKGMR